MTRSYTTAKKRIWRCPTLACWAWFGLAMQLCHFNNFLLLKAWCSSLQPSYTAPDSPTEPQCLSKQAASQIRKLNIFLWLYIPKLISWQVRWVLVLEHGRMQKHAALTGSQNCPFWKEFPARSHWLPPQAAPLVSCFHKNTKFQTSLVKGKQIIKLRFG